MLPDNCQHQGGLEGRDLSNWCILSVSKLIVHHRMAWVAEDLKDYLVATPCHGCGLKRSPVQGFHGLADCCMSLAPLSLVTKPSCMCHTILQAAVPYHRCRKESVQRWSGRSGRLHHGKATPHALHCGSGWPAWQPQRTPPTLLAGRGRRRHPSSAKTWMKQNCILEQTTLQDSTTWVARALQASSCSSWKPGLTGWRGALTMRFTMIILGPSVLLTVKICIRRRQKIIKANDSMMRPGYKVDGMSLGTEERKGNSSVIPVRCFFF